MLDESRLQVWAKTFDRELRNVFEIQSEIAEAVATTVAAQLAPAPPKTYVPDVAAYDTFLRGREQLHKRERSRRAKHCDGLSSAIRISPEPGLNSRSPI